MENFRSIVNMQVRARAQEQARVKEMNRIWEPINQTLDFCMSQQIRWRGITVVAFRY